MKLILTLIALVSTNLYAASVIIDIDGVRHQCTPISSGNPTQCFNTAYAGPFSRDEAMKLCAGAYSDAPAQCALLSYGGRYSKDESIKLCIGSTTNTGPVDCANMAYAGPFSKEESLKLCSHNGSERIGVCAIEAYRGPYTKAEAIDMCKNPYFHSNKDNQNSNALTKEALNLMIDEANVKAIERKEYK